MNLQKGITVTAFGAISADDHLQEPVTLWQERLPKRLVDKGPRLIELDNGSHAFQIGSSAPKPLDGLIMAGGAIEGGANRKAVRWENVRPGFWRPADRLKDMELDGVWATVLYPNMILDICMNQVDVDVEAKLPIIQVYNDHMNEFCAHDPNRLIGYAILPTQSPEQAVAEMQRIRKSVNIAGILLPVKPDVSDWIDPIWEPVWATAQELNLTMSVHAGKPRWMARRSELDGKGQMMIYFHLGYSSVVETTAQIFWTGAFERYPKLKLVSVEGDIGWLPHFKRRAKKMASKHGQWMGLKTDPSEWFGRNYFATFESDPIGIRNRDEIGVDTLMWAADYPHSASSFPGSMKQIERDFGELSKEERRKITWDNVAKLYGIKPPPAG
jgi:predicted TIM-barrel fold metal-dependent hydrolase